VVWPGKVEILGLAIRGRAKLLLLFLIKSSEGREHVLLVVPLSTFLDRLMLDPIKGACMVDPTFVRLRDHDIW
jgi:hypothetical protein